MLWLGVAAGAVIGGILTWLLASRTQASKIGLLEGQLSETRQRETELNSQLKQAAEKIEFLTQDLGKLTQQTQDQKDLLEKAKDSFKSLSSEALKSNKDDFLQLAKESLNAILKETRGDLGKHKEQIDSLVKPLHESLVNYQKNLHEMEKIRKEDKGSLGKHLEEITKINRELQSRTGELATALKNPKVGGKWGELTLKRAAELAGMTEYCDFEEQVSKNTETGRLRPDMVVHLPGGRTIAVDAKISYQSYIDAINETDESRRKELLRRYTQAIKSHINQLSSKSYSDYFKDDATELVVLFLPGESFFSAAFLADHELIEYGMERNILLASPTTLIALLRAVAFGWRGEQLAENAKKIRDEGEEFFNRITNFLDHFYKIGNSMGTTIKHYNAAVGSLESRLLPSARKFSEMGIGKSDKIPPITVIDTQPRELT